MVITNKKVDPREKFYKRNYITFMFEAFFFSFSLSIFSHTTILPVYIKNLSENTIWISLLALVFFTFSNLSSVFSCILGVNTKNAKWLAIIICGLQRFSQFLIYMSTLSITNSKTLAIVIFFISYTIYSITAGMSLPVFSNLVSRVMYRNVSSFYGSYTLFGALSGIIGSQMVRISMENYNFPLNYQYMFLAGVTMSIIATFVLVFGIKEVPREQVKKIHFYELPNTLKNIIQKNHTFRSFIIIRILVAAAEMTIPFFIIRISNLPNLSAGFVGTMATVLLISNLIFSKILGNLGDKKRPYFLLKLGGFAGIIACIISIYISSSSFGYVLFIIVSVATLSVTQATNISTIIYSKNEYVPIYAATTGICIALFMDYFL